PAPGVATLTAAPTSITAGASSTLTLTTPAGYHNILINDTPPACNSSTTGETCTLVVSPTATTTYQSAATGADNVVYTMPSVTVTVTGSAWCKPRYPHLTLQT